MFSISFPASLLLVYSSMFFYNDFISYNFANLIHLLILTFCSCCTQGFLYVTLCFLTIVKSVSCSVACDSATPWTVGCQVPLSPLSTEFSRQEYWRGWPSPSPGDLSNPGIKPGSPALQADSLPSKPWQQRQCKSFLSGLDAFYFFFLPNCSG